MTLSLIDGHQDYVLVEESIAEALFAEMKSTLKTFFGENPQVCILCFVLTCGVVIYASSAKRGTTTSWQSPL